MEKSVVKLSVCIPVYNSEKVLSRCLESVFAQDYTDWEVIIVNDGSNGKDEQNRNCKKIIKQFQKLHKLSKKKVIYLEHPSNMGLVETRRTLVEAANSQYILMLDSDDVLLPDALSRLYEIAIQTKSDIVHGCADVYCNDSSKSSQNKNRIENILKKANNIHVGELTGENVFNDFLSDQGHSGFLWAKLIRRETYLQALSYIPFTNCVYAEDYLQYFFISYCAKKYSGSKTHVYRYTVDTGISSSQKITDLNHWEKICSTANVFTIIFSAIEEFSEIKLSLEQIEAVRLMSRSYLVNNIRQLNSFVIPELQPQARTMLCEYWGKDFVETMERAMNE